MKNFTSSPLPLIISAVVLLIGAALLIGAGIFLLSTRPGVAEITPTPPISETRISIPTATTAPTSTPTPTNTAIPPTQPPTAATASVTPTATVIVPTQPQVTAVPRTNTPAPPTATPTGAQSSKLNNIQFSVENPTVAANSAIWFNFSVTNASTTASIQLGKVGVVVLSNGANVHFHTSWTGWVLNAGATQAHRDSVTIGTAGAYQLQLSICYSTVEACQGTGGEWQQVGQPISVTVQ